MGFLSNLFNFNTNLTEQDRGVIWRMFGSFGAFYFYFPAIFGVKYSRIYAYLHYSYYLVGQLMTVIPMF
jgi:heme/copper-type cytochrome/quinol oxidase subunit 1